VKVKGLSKERVFNVLLAVATVVFFVALFSVKVYATDAADTMWNTLSDLIGTWVLRLGGVVMFVGGVMFGLGWKNDDAEQKSRGVQTMIAGAIVMALAGMVGTFFGTG
jgi:predicted membrane channel-forming protein YqfA (hemolysin III family)